MAGYTPPNVSFTSPNAEAGNPYSAKFFATQAALNASLEKGLAEEQRNAQNTEAQYKYNLGVNAQNEGRALRAGGQRANTEGLAESGVLAQRQGVTQTGAAQKTHGLGENRRKAIESYQQGAATKQLDYASGTAANVGNAEEAAKQYAIEHPPLPTEPTTTPSVLTPTRAAAAAGAPRVVGVTRQPNTGGPAPRRTAIQKVKAKGRLVL